MQTRSRAKKALAAAPLNSCTQSSSSTVAALVMLGSLAILRNSCAGASLVLSCGPVAVSHLQRCAVQKDRSCLLHSVLCHQHSQQQEATGSNVVVVACCTQVACYASTLKTGCNSMLMGLHGLGI